MLICGGELREPRSGASVINSWRSRVSIWWYSIAAPSMGGGGGEELEMNIVSFTSLIAKSKKKILGS